jgi:hypothetical protein
MLFLGYTLMLKPKSAKSNTGPKELHGFSDWFTIKVNGKQSHGASMAIY